MYRDVTYSAKAYLLQSPTEKYINMERTQKYMKSQTNRVHCAGVIGVAYFRITSSVRCWKTPEPREAFC